MKTICKIFSKSKPVVAHLNLQGVIGAKSKFDSNLNFESTGPLIKSAFETNDVKAVAISINSPGGSPVQSELIYNYIRELSSDKKIPVYTFAQDVAASGGYWLLLAGDEIYAHQASIIGSIGVIFSSFGFVDLLKKIGIERRVYTEGKNKAILDPFMPEQQENIEILKQAQSDIFEGFKSLVRKRREGKLTKAEDDVFTGAFWSGNTALKLGLIDGVSDIRSKMKEKFGDKIEIINITQKKSWLKNLLSSKSSANQLEAAIHKLEEKIIFSKFGL